MLLSLFHFLSVMAQSILSLSWDKLKYFIYARLDLNSSYLKWNFHEVFHISTQVETRTVN